MFCFLNKAHSLAGGQTLQAFRKDVEATYQEIVSFVNEAAAEGVKIQLEAKDPDTVISFNVPDGPPGENSILEGLMLRFPTPLSCFADHLRSKVEIGVSILNPFCMRIHLFP